MNDREEFCLETLIRERMYKDDSIKFAILRCEVMECYRAGKADYRTAVAMMGLRPYEAKK